MNTHSKSVLLALSAAVLAVVFWTAKAAAIGIAGGLDRSPAESPLFLAGLLAFVVGVVSIGVALTAGRRAWIRAIAGVGAFVVGLAVGQAVGAITAALQPADPSWVWAELELWVIAPLALAVALLVARRAPATP